MTMIPTTKSSKHTQRTLAVAGAALLVAGLTASMSCQAQPQPTGYVLTPVIATLGDPSPGGGQFTFDFEPWSINARGQLAFGADLTTGGEGIFIASNGDIAQIARSGDPAPGGSVFSFVFLGSPALNNQGDVAFTFALEPFALPFGVKAGVYRFSHVDSQLHAVVVPGVTPA